MQKRTTYFSLLLTLVMLLVCGCQSSNQQRVEMPLVQPRSIIIDTDTGGDDAAAIIMAALQPEIDLLGITVVSGNVPLEQGAKNALMSLEIAGRTDMCPSIVGLKTPLPESSTKSSVFTAKMAWGTLG